MKALFVALPYCNAKLHLGRLGGTFIPCDIYKRFLKKFKNEKCEIYSGLDCYGTSVFLDAKSKDQEAKMGQFILKQQLNFTKTLKTLGIQLRYNFRTNTNSHRRFVNSEVINLLKYGRVYVTKNKRFYCEDCKTALPDRFLIDELGQSFEKLRQKNEDVSKCNFCIFCKNHADLKEMPALSLKYDLKEASEAKKKLIQLNVKQTQKELTRCYLEWGLSCGESLKKILGQKAVFYVWIEALYSYLEQYKRAIRKNRIDSSVYFYGQDNQYFHQIIYPQLLNSKNEIIDPLNPKTKVFKRFFFMFNNAKMSSSDVKTSLGLDDLPHLNPDVLRYVLAKNDCLHSNSNICKELLQSESEVFFKKYVNLAKRISVLSKAYPIKVKKELPAQIYKSYVKEMTENNLKEVTRILDRYQKEITLKIEDLFKVKGKKDEKIISQIYNEVISLFELLEPISPLTSRKILKALKNKIDFQYDLNRFSIA